ncbi:MULTISPECIES: hypothetical protein [unclassified Bacillus (in: firmicutes)]|uniref:hypothetical protein n=1 Tax=unclassified Bacillus (in: firmicutes) TaxID=185979 RepID=UPI0008F2CADC|nr:MULTISPECIES: hypothetical protein [unclassified Bacillus (in: firmicutes)]SFA80313.1 hypothetical protein SAMN02799634_101927 [Bacillus sp. UNCCL13]SFQ70370.1 hypothetical protein SAMN04488577_1203 [Bacillus sp. cl95]
MSNSQVMHPTIRKCLQHLEILDADDKTKQIVYMYMESLYKELTEVNLLPHENMERDQISN